MLLIALPYLGLCLYSVFIFWRLMRIFREKKINKNLRNIILSFCLLPMIEICGFFLYFLRQVLNLCGIQVGEAYETVQYCLINLEGLIIAIFFAILMVKSQEISAYDQESNQGSLVQSSGGKYNSDYIETIVTQTVSIDHSKVKLIEDQPQYLKNFEEIPNFQAQFEEELPSSRDVDVNLILSFKGKNLNNFSIFTDRSLPGNALQQNWNDSLVCSKDKLDQVSQLKFEANRASDPNRDSLSEDPSIKQPEEGAHAKRREPRLPPRPQALDPLPVISVIKEEESPLDFRRFGKLLKKVQIGSDT